MIAFNWGNDEQLEKEQHRESLSNLVWSYAAVTYSHEVCGWLLSGDFFLMTQPQIERAKKRRTIKPHFFLMCDGTVDQQTVKPILSIPSNRYIIN